MAYSRSRHTTVMILSDYDIVSAKNHYCSVARAAVCHSSAIPGLAGWSVLVPGFHQHRTDLCEYALVLWTGELDLHHRDGLRGRHDRDLGDVTNPQSHLSSRPRGGSA